MHRRDRGLPAASSRPSSRRRSEKARQTVPTSDHLCYAPFSSLHFRLCHFSFSNNLRGMRTVQVPLGTRTYTIVVDRKLLSTLGERCGNFGLSGRCAVITDKKVAAHYAKNALYALKKVGLDPVLITIPPGEKAKSLAVVQKCYDALAKHRLERKSFIVALGGEIGRASCRERV